MNGATTHTRKGTTYPARILSPEGLVKTQFIPQVSKGLRGRIDTQDNLGRITGQNKQNRKNNQCRN